MTGYVAINGKINPAEKSAIPALDRGFLFGDNVFEVLAGFGSKILDIVPHLERLRRSAEEILMPIPWSNEEMTFELEHLASLIPSPKKYFRLVVTRGSGFGLHFGKDLTPNRILFGFPATPAPERFFKEGIGLKIKTLPYTIRGASIKTGNYLKSIVALHEVEALGFDDVLWSNSEGEITEASTANVFFLEREGDGVRFITPALNSGLLEGITRTKLIRLLRSAKIPCEERIIYSDEIPKYDEAFISSSVRGLIPLAKIDLHRLQTCRANSVFRHIERLYLTSLEAELGFRVDWNTGLKA